MKPRAATWGSNKNDMESFAVSLFSLVFSGDFPSARRKQGFFLKNAMDVYKVPADFVVRLSPVRLD